jgi:hypothetical protein
MAHLLDSFLCILDSTMDWGCNRVLVSLSWSTLMSRTWISLMWVALMQASSLL